MYDVCAAILGARPVALTPDAIAAVWKSVDWLALPGWEAKTDSEVAAESGLLCANFRGTVLVVTEASFAPTRGAFVLDERALGAFVRAHLPSYGECFFNGDVIVANGEGRRLWLFHHEGVYATISA